eukprot:6246808-Amphidinium_carterae.1
MARAMNVTAEEPSQLFDNICAEISSVDPASVEYDFATYSEIVEHIARVSEQPDREAPWYLLDGAGLYPLAGDFDTEGFGEVVETGARYAVGAASGGGCRCGYVVQQAKPFGAPGFIPHEIEFVLAAVRPSMSETVVDEPAAESADSCMNVGLRWCDFIKAVRYVANIGDVSNDVTELLDTE